MSQDPTKERLELAITLLNQKKLGELLLLSEKMLEEFPKSIILYNILGATYSGLKQFESAIKSYKKAIDLNPSYAEAYYNMGIAFKNIDNYDSAINSYEKALEINPSYTAASFNLGNIYKSLDKLDSAIESYKHAINTNPKHFESHFNLGNLLFDKGDYPKAIESYLQAKKIRPESTEIFKNLSKVFKRIVFIKPNSDLSETIISILDKKSIIKPIDLSRSAISLIKLDPYIEKLLAKNSETDISNSIETTVSNLSKNRLLLKLMSICLIPDPQIETILRNVRYYLIKSIHQIKLTPDFLLFQSALALQCFTNEYIYFQNKKETSLLKSLDKEVESSILKGEQPKASSILCLASYKPLYKYTWSNLLENMPAINDVFVRQIFEPSKEKNIKSEISSLKKINNKISSKVRDQYEDNPYPRWINTALGIENNSFSEIKERLDLKISDKRIKKIENPEILIAGCGTGQHSVRVASRYKEAKILAIDLSLSSLAYAKRKTIELGINNIDYMQADILDLEKLNTKFDMIQSSGVLHHMHNPMAGWKTLRNCLKNGGLMKVGLYSELARRHIIQIRQELENSGINLNDNQIRTIRKNYIDSKVERHEKIKLNNNFYSLSEIRDLLFHVQEHQFTIPKIKNCLDELNLKFCGFESTEILSDFRSHYPKKNDLYNLNKWHSYEKENPDIFIAMYQFWCQKAD